MSASPATTARRTLRALAITSLLVLAPAAPAFAKGGGGGGGTGGGGGGGTTTTTAGVIKSPTSALVTCTGGTTMTLTVQKGNNKVVEGVITMTGTTGGWWDYNLVEDTSGRRIIGFGGTTPELGTSSSVTTISTGSTLQPGTWALSFSAVHRESGQTSPIVETCSAHLTVVAV